MTHSVEMGPQSYACLSLYLIGKDLTHNSVPVCLSHNLFMICKSKKNVLQIDSVFLDPFALEYCYLGKLSRIMVGSLNTKKHWVYIM
jgi:hypothetical protein